MASRREGLFPSASVGRAHGMAIQRTGSHDAIAAHPLLSPTSPAHASSSSSLDSTPPAPTPKYVPYTPRQRVAPTSATTGTTMHPTPPQQHQGPGGATSKLQLVNLKAAAQKVGLDTGCVGWAILERLMAGEDWNDVWDALAGGKATLLLPLEPTTTPVTVELIKDHVVFCDGPARDDAPFVFLSGIRGTLQSDTLSLRSSLPPTSKPFEAISNPSSRAAALASLPPLPVTPSYPAFTLPSYTAALPLPPRPPAPTKPALPPRPGQRTSSTPGTSRISNPFASLFGKPPLSSPSSPSTPAAPAPRAGSPTSISSVEGAEHAVVEVSAFTIDRRVLRKEVGRAMHKAIKAEVEDVLGGVKAPAWVTARVHKFTEGLYPLIKAPRTEEKQGGGGYVVNAVLDGESPEEVAGRWQEFYAGVEEELRAGGSSKKEKEGEGEEEGREKEKEKEKGMSEGRIREIMEGVEKAVCSTFYDRLFRPPTSDDASHDEALSSRIAALNVLDLSLDHLGVDVGSGAVGREVRRIVGGCGAALSRLESGECRCPADKAAVLVAAHKLVVDGLSRLPPIRLKSEQEIEQQRSPRASNFEEEEEGKEREMETSPISERGEASRAEEAGEYPVPPSSSPPQVASPEPLEIELPSAEDSANREREGSSLSPVPPSPMLTVSPPPETAPANPTPVSGDILLPLIIFAVVKANPSHLVSHLLYIQRFRNQSVGGEEGYCLINLMAVAEFLENVDLGALGLQDDEKRVISAADLTPIPIARNGLTPDSPIAQGSVLSAGSILRGRVEQQVDAIAGSANKMISGVVDSSFGVLRALLPGTVDQGALTPPADEVQGSAPWNARPGFGLLRRESGFSIASLAASLPGRERTKPAGNGEEKGQQLVEVSSRPGSSRSVYGREGEEGESSEEEEEEGDEEDDDDYDEEDGEEGGHDTRSIRSFESMMSDARKKMGEKRGRKSIVDRLAQVPGLGRLSQPAGGSESHKTSPPPPSKRSSLLPPGHIHAPTRFDTPVSSRSTSPSPIALRLGRPNQRFLECTEEDLRVSEVGELLREYKRLVEGVRAIGGFDE